VKRLKGHEIALGFALGVGLFAVTAIFLSVSDIVPREICEQTGEQNQKQCATYGVPFVLAWSIGKALNWLAPLLGAFATIAIAYYTFSLKRATNNLWHASSEQANTALIAAQAAKKSADVSESALNPFVTVEIDEAHICAILDRADGAKIPVVVSNAYINFRFQNYGRTPAIVKAIKVESIISKTPPSRDAEILIDIGANRVARFEIPFGKTHLPIMASNEERMALPRQDTFVWFFGMIEFDDMFGAEYISKFCMKYDGRECSLYPYDGDRKRNKCTRYVRT
jgi:hypothetical protein